MIFAWPIETNYFIFICHCSAAVKMDFIYLGFKKLLLPAFFQIKKSNKYLRVDFGLFVSPLLTYDLGNRL